MGLSGSYIGDNSCCQVTASAPSILPIAPAGLFTTWADNLYTSVFSTDSTTTGPGGDYYTFTYTTPMHASGCYTTPTDLIFYL